MIGVTVGEHNRVDASDVVLERLRPQIGRRIDEHITNRRRDGRLGRPGSRRRPLVPKIDQDRRPEPPIPRIGGAADEAIASDGRHAMRRTGAQKSYAHDGVRDVRAR